MIYIIVEWNTDSSVPRLTAHTIKSEYKEHLKVCQDLYKTLCGGYQYHTYKVYAEYKQGKKAISRAITEYCLGGIEQTKGALQEAVQNEEPD